jgi:hypothetical protein
MKRSFLALSLAMAAGPLALLACGEEAPQPMNPTTVTVTAPSSAAPVASPSTAPSPVVTTPPPPPPPPAPVVVDVTASEDPKPAPALKFTAPALNASIDPKKANDFVVKLDVKNWDMKDGKHLHLVLDDQPYKKITDLKAPIKLGELLPPGGSLNEGQHILFVFPGRPTHETVKAKGAIGVVTFWVGKPGKTATFDLKKPMVIYSRPKGANVGDMGKNVMIDFSLVNTALDKGEKVKFTMTGGALKEPLTGEFTKWAPKIVNNLQKGDYALKLELFDKDGKLVEQPIPATGKFTVDPDAANDPALGAAWGTTPAPAASSAAPAASTSAKPAPAASSAKPK